MHDDLLSALESLMLDCGNADWDGYAGIAVSMDAYHAAKRFIGCLPVDIPQPELTADPDGHVTFEWWQSSRYTLLVSVRPDDTLDYAALIGASKAHGAELWLGLELPAILALLIQRVVDG